MLYSTEFSEEFASLMPALSSEGGSLAPATAYVSLETLRHTFYPARMHKPEKLKHANK